MGAPRATGRLSWIVLATILIAFWITIAGSAVASASTAAVSTPAPTTPPAPTGPNERGSGLPVFTPAPAAAKTPTPTDTAKGPSPTKASDSAGIPGAGLARKVLGRVGDVVGSAGSTVTSGVASGVVKTGMTFIADSLFGGVQGLFAELGTFLSTTTHPDPTQASFIGPGGVYQQVASFSIVILVGFIFLQVIHGIFAGEPGQAVLHLARDIPLAVLAIVGFPWFIGQVVTLADALTELVLPPGQTLGQLLQIQVLTNLKSVATANPVPGVLMDLLAFLAALLIYLELLVHVVMVRLIEALAPLSFAPLVWAPARPAARKVAELAVAAVLSRPAILIALRVGLDLLSESARGSPLSGGAWGRLLLGLAVIAVAACAPAVIWRLLPHAEAMLAAQGLARGPGRAMMTGLQTAYWVQMLGGQAARGRPRSGGGSSGGAPSGDGPGPVRGLPMPAGPHSPAGGGRAATAGTGAAAGAATAGATTAATAVMTATSHLTTAATNHTEPGASPSSPPRPGGPGPPPGPSRPGAAPPGPGRPPAGPPGPGGAPGWTRRPPRRPGPGSNP